MAAINIIVMDDHPVVREGLIFMIEREPDIKILADSGDASEVVKLVEEHKPDVLLIDVHMEGQTFNIVKKALLAHPELKILFITAFDSEENHNKAKKIGANGLVSKLEGAKGICKALRIVSEGESYFSEAGVARQKVKKLSRSNSTPVHHPLSPREVDVLCCVAHAMTAKEIANDLHISVKTVDRHKANIMDKLKMRSQIELARYAIRHGFVEA